ncbi:MAG: DUF2341 domain-containing protein [Euryarchaeota archaeon]|nr:DUF2341 domain-containing protein [Euryarchaeota archaeon]
MRRIPDNQQGVSNVIAYLLSFVIASTVMTSSVLITTGIIQDKTAQIASVEAQNLANKIADALVEAIASRQSMPDSECAKTLAIPVYLAGLEYYVEVTDTAVYVNTTNGMVSKKSTTYAVEDLNIGFSSDRIYSGSGKIEIIYNKPAYVYKFDFGKGNSTSHSPVESGYYMVTESFGITSCEPGWVLPNSYPADDYPYRIPINVSNPSSDNLTNISVQITLNPKNFDYNHARVIVASSSTVFSDLIFCDPDSSTPIALPYYIDYWNPHGESIVLVNMSIRNNSYKQIFLYYGYNGLLTGPGGFHKHTIENVSLFYDDFNSNLDKWTNAGGTIANGNLTLGEGGTITSNFEIPLIETPKPIQNKVNASEVVYVIDAKMQIYNNTYCRKVLLDPTEDTNSYQILAKCISNSRLLLEKYKNSAPMLQEVDNSTASNLNQSLRWKTYVYISKNCYKVGGDPASYTNATYITSYIYNFSTFAHAGNNSGLDTYPDTPADPSGPPFLNWKILLANIDDLGPNTGKIIVDWIRLVKIPVVPLTVSMGPRESRNYGWENSVKADDRPTPNPFNPGPVLRDFNYDSTPQKFIIKHLSKGNYTFTVSMGNYSGTCDMTTIEFSESGTTLGTLTVPATESGQFETRWITLHKPNDDSDLEIRFSAETNKKWVINSLSVELGEKGIKLI